MTEENLKCRITSFLILLVTPCLIQPSYAGVTYQSCFELNTKELLMNFPSLSQRREGDSNPRYRFAVHTLSRRAS